MTTPQTQGRVLPFPLGWRRNRVRPSALQDTAGVVALNDEELMALLQARDSTALHLLFDRYSRLTLGIAFRILDDYGEAEEVVQETFFQVHQKAMIFDPSKGTVKAWIVQIAFHRALDRRAYLERRSFYTGTDVSVLDDTLLEDTDLDREIDTKLNRVQLEKAFVELPKMQRRTLELFYFEGLELREISERLGESLPNIRHHYYRGLAKLRQSAFVQKLREK